MQAWLCRRYGGPEVLALQEVPRPVPRRGEILIRVRATTVSAGDWRVRSLTMPPGLGPIARLALGLRGPRQPILGTELAGVVEAVGAGVTRFRPGDAVVASPGARMGCHAEYRALPEDGPVVAMPGNLSFAEAAAIPFGALTALHFLDRAAIRPGERLLVIGASGAVGTALVQLAHDAGAEVTGVTSTANLALVAALGAARVIDYTVTDVTGEDATHDVIADAVGTKRFAHCAGILAEGGRFLAIAGGLPDMLAALRCTLGGTRRVLVGPAPDRPEALQRVMAMAAAGRLRPVIDSCHGFARMAEAHARVDTGRKRGSVVVTLP